MTVVPLQKIVQFISDGPVKHIVAETTFRASANLPTPKNLREIILKFDMEDGSEYHVPVMFGIFTKKQLEDKISDSFIRYFEQGFPAKLYGAEKGVILVPPLKGSPTLNVMWERNFSQYRVKGNTDMELKEKPPQPKFKLVNTKKAEDGSPYLPAFRPDYTPFGVAFDLEKILATGFFMPVYITGLSGNGKTLSVGQICRKLGRELIRANITADTDEDDLIGHYTLVNGETVWHEGPVATAMKRGAVLLLDEVDLATNKMMCLQPVLEGNPIFIKKTGEYIIPAPGFTIIATANTKGKGDDTGNFSGTNVLNEAFLDRFSVVLHQDYPAKEIEYDILVKNATAMVGNLESCDAIFMENLIEFAAMTRTGFESGEFTDVVTTRRLCNAITLFFLYDRDEDYVINAITARFDKETQDAFKKVYYAKRKPLFYTEDQDRHAGSRERSTAKPYEKLDNGNYKA